MNCSFLRRPPFCPNPCCDYHANSQGWRFKKKGFYARAASPRRIQRYLCSHCGQSFSSQTFSLSYWLKRPDLISTIFTRLVSCSGYRQIARELAVAPSTIEGLALRIGRHCQLFHEQKRRKGKIQEPLVIDGFRSFEFSQYHPIEVQVAVGAHSHFFYGFTICELRRSGAMTPSQRQRREEIEATIGRPNPRAVERSVRELLWTVLEGTHSAEIRSDQHSDYPRAMASIAEVRFRHETTSSRRMRDSRNPLFPVNLLDLLITHSSANHKRETIAFSKRRHSAAARLWVFLTWRNYVKHWSERRRDQSPAEKAGLMATRLQFSEVLDRRLFPSRVPLPDAWRRHYDGEMTTRALRQNRRHRKRRAY